MTLKFGDFIFRFVRFAGLDYVDMFLVDRVNGPEIFALQFHRNVNKFGKVEARFGLDGLDKISDSGRGYLSIREGIDFDNLRLGPRRSVN